MYKVIALIGESGSGKDSILSELMTRDSNLNRIVGSTTRPPREKEVNGKDYHFISGERFGELFLGGDIIEATMFNEDWFYGTNVSELKEDVVNIGIFNPEAAEILSENPMLNLTIFYIETSPKERLIRQLSREEYPDIEEILRRYKEDQNDFYDLDFRHKTVSNNSKEDFELAVRTILGTIG